MLYSWLISSIHMLSNPVFSESTDFPGLSFRFVASRWTCQHPDGFSDGFRSGFSVCWFLMLGFLLWTISNKLERPKKEHIFFNGVPPQPTFKKCDFENQKISKLFIAFRVMVGIQVLPSPPNLPDSPVMWESDSLWFPWWLRESRGGK